jgi:NAD(P)H-dependent flavin oxidoreductase YrpB (nitropropane dioxygenase family)
MLAAGADAVRVGTRFVATVEADAHPDYQAALVAARAEDTVLSTAFAVGWPDAPHRVLASCIEAASRRPSDEPVAIVNGKNGAYPLMPFTTIPPSRRTRGDIAATALYAGFSVEHVHGVQRAADVVAELMGAGTGLSQDTYGGVSSLAENAGTLS